MRQENTPTIYTKRLLLRRFTKADAGALLALLADEEVNRFLPWFPLTTLDEAEAFLQQRFLAHYEQSSGYRYAICQREEGPPIGYVWLSAGESHDFGYALQRAHWHKGLATEAAAAVAARIGEAGYPYLTATHDRENPRSGAVMRQLGMLYQYSYVEQWQPKNIPVTFRMYQLNFQPGQQTYSAYWKESAAHFMEESI